jgi:hypothetical protein
MPKRIPEAELNEILSVITQFPGGGSVDEVSEKLDNRVPRRTLQYRLAHLVVQKQLVPEGEGRGRKYRIPNVVLQAESGHFAVKGNEVNVERYISISADSKKIKDTVRLPVEERKPVGYRQEFLTNYRPNETFYLPEQTRKNLLKKSQSSDELQPAGTYIKQILNRLLIDLSWNSSRLEGNTYSLLETERLLELGENAEGKDATEAQMILNHKTAIEMLADQTMEIGFNRYTILNLHALLSENLLADPQAGGRLRHRTVEIGGSVFHPLNVPQLVDECFDQILASAEAIQDPFEQAFFIMVHIPYLQPFEVVNKQVSRLAANIPFIKSNLSPLSFVDVPERAYVDGLLGVYELNNIELLRDVFVWAYERSCARYSAVSESLGEPDVFRIRYRNNIHELVTALVRDCVDKKSAATRIKIFANENIPDTDRSRFIEIVETELLSLHEGNIAKYRLRPSEYQKWRTTWS